MERPLEEEAGCSGEATIELGARARRVSKGMKLSIVVMWSSRLSRVSLNADDER